MTNGGRSKLSDPRIDDALDTLVRSGELGVQVAAYLGEELIVDTWVGTKDDSGTEVDGDTLFQIFSAGKAQITMLAHIFDERGLIDLDEPIATYWPEYSRHGKDRITTRHVISHVAGVPQMPQDLTLDKLDDWEWIMDRLADIEPIHPPGERSFYHGLSIYFLVGSVLYRTDPQHRLFDVLLREEICEPLGIENMWYRLPAEQEPRVATLVQGDHGPRREGYKMMVPPASNPDCDWQNRPQVHQSLCGNLFTTARDGAKFWSILANGGEINGLRLLSEERVRGLTRPRFETEQVDGILEFVMEWGYGGFQHGRTRYMAPVVGGGPGVLTQTGGGGTLGWADLETGLAAMYTHNFHKSHAAFAAFGDAVRTVAAEHGGNP